MRIVGSMVVGPGERWLKEALEDIKWCDEIFVCLNNADERTEKIAKDFGCIISYDNREWGKLQWKIKEDFFNEFTKYLPDWIVTKDADEVFDKNFRRPQAEELAEKGGTGWNFYVINLYDEGYNKEFSFWNCRYYRYNPAWNNKWQRRNLHCGLYPLFVHRWANFAPYILKHYGLISKELRDKKVARYKKYDPNCHWMRMNQQYYDFIASQARVTPYDEDKLHLKAKNFADKTYFKSPKTVDTMGQKLHYVRNLKSGELVPVEDGVLQDILKQNLGRDYKYEGEIKEEDAEGPRGYDEAPVKKREPSICEICGTKCASPEQLEYHVKKHENEHESD